MSDIEMKPQLPKKILIPGYVFVLLGLVLVAGGYFRLIGLDWDESLHLHPDERFLTMVESSIAPVKSFSEYFNTQTSTLNPHNVGFPSFVYGTLPIFLVRYLAQAFQMEGYAKVYLLGRAFSAFIDLLNILLVFFISLRLYRKPWLSLTASALMAFAVLPIQLSHYFTVDSYLSFFCTLAFGTAVLIMTERASEADDLPDCQEPDSADEEDSVHSVVSWEKAFSSKDPGFIGFILFGVAYGMAMASKINAASLLVLLVLASFVYFVQVSEERKNIVLIQLLRNFAVTGLAAFLTFRVFQPYAFSGPGFFNILPNEKWIANLKELISLSGGDVDYPPSLQWARRPVTFAWKNMVVWGMGLPFGLTAWAGLVMMGWKMLRGEWKQHLLLWGWTVIYFLWQNSSFNPSMRYFIPLYPMFAMIAAWFIFRVGESLFSLNVPWQTFRKVMAVLPGFLIVTGTFLWAFAFTRIYANPMTRVAASRWVYRNIPGAINFPVKTDAEVINYPFNVRNETGIVYNQPLSIAFRAENDCDLLGFQFKKMKRALLEPSVDKTGEGLRVIVSSDPQGKQVLGEVVVQSEFSTELIEAQFVFNQVIQLEKNRQYYIILQPESDKTLFSVSGIPHLMVENDQGRSLMALPSLREMVGLGQDVLLTVSFKTSGLVDEIVFYKALDWSGNDQTKKLVARMVSSDGKEELSQGSITSVFAPGEGGQGKEYHLKLQPALQVEKDTHYSLVLSLSEGDGAISFYHPLLSEETSWDDAIPQNIDGYIAYDLTLGLYPRTMNFEMYWDDNQEKQQRMETILDDADYIVITSNRQYATTVRVPERYPMTTVFYRNLLGCPADKDIVWCYNTAAPGTFKGGLGYDLIKTFQSNPTLGGLEFNSQFAEEAFTVYDAPKVLIFKKTADYDPLKTRALLRSVDLNQVQHLTPKQASESNKTLMFSVMDWAKQRTGGTWKDLFNRSDLLNRNQAVGVCCWYFSLWLLGWLVFPITWSGFSGLQDKGYSFARLTGLLLVAYFCWLGGSVHFTFNRLLILLVLSGIGIISLLILRKNYREIRIDVLSNKRLFWISDLVFLVLFLIILGVRLGNPDLWHPWLGGEKPMDFAYFNAVIKSSLFPAYDPWFAGGYLNYYYFGFVMVGTWVKLLGIIPSFAYNLILPTLFAMAGTAAFGVAYHLVCSQHKPLKETENQKHPILSSPWLGGAGAAVFMMLMGNLGTIRMIWHGIMRLAPGADLNEAGFFDSIRWTIQGLGSLFSGTPLPYGRGNWYWIPSRVYQTQNVITEFPLFTFFYADLHAHMLALPLTVMILGLCVSWIKGNHSGTGLSRIKYWQIGVSWFLAALTVGALKPTNTWDYPAYLIFALVALVYSFLRKPLDLSGAGEIRNPFQMRVLFAIIGVVVVALGSQLLFLPYTQSYGAAYTSLELWKLERSDFWSYLTHWGFFLFVLIAWLASETRNWMAATPAVALLKLKRYKVWIWLALGLIVAAMICFILLKITIGGLVLLLAIWAGLLIFRPDQTSEKRMVLFMFGTALMLTLFVELVVLKGDIGRMNTVFKFYYQSWTLFSIASAAAFAWLIPSVLQEWNRTGQTVFQLGLGFLLAGTLLFSFMAGTDKIHDRMSDKTPLTLDGMTYMNSAHYNYDGQDIELAEDYRAIQWMQDHVSGSPVIVECSNCNGLYKWCARYSIYTGLPQVIGWDWHQRQQRAVLPGNLIADRIAEVGNFYQTADRNQTVKFLEKYQVEYIIVGRLERRVYTHSGIEKFDAWNHDLWQLVYHDGETDIYQVIP